MTVISCSIKSTVIPRARIRSMSRMSSWVSVGFIPAALVQQQQPRVGSEGAGDLEATPVGVGEGPGWPAGAREEPIPEEPQQLGRPILHAATLGAGTGHPEKDSGDPGPRSAVRADQDVLQHRHVIEEARGLERARDLEPRDPDS